MRVKDEGAKTKDPILSICFLSDRVITLKVFENL